jgi:hypothetical protein
MNTKIRYKAFAFLIPTIWALAVASAHAQGQFVNWERIEGINPNPAGGQVFAGINPVTFPWSSAGGRARLNTANGRLHFEVRGLAIGASPTPLAVVGTTGAVTEVLGTILCNATGEYVDSDPVELWTSGDASFHGSLPYMITCNDESWVFLLRVAGVVPGAPPITGRWLAHGAARNLHQVMKHPGEY